MAYLNQLLQSLLGYLLWHLLVILPDTNQPTLTVKLYALKPFEFHRTFLDDPHISSNPTALGVRSVSRESKPRGESKKAASCLKLSSSTKTFGSWLDYARPDFCTPIETVQLYKMIHNIWKERNCVQKGGNLPKKIGGGNMRLKWYTSHFPVLPNVQYIMIHNPAWLKFLRYKLELGMRYGLLSKRDSHAKINCSTTTYSYLAVHGQLVFWCDFYWGWRLILKL